MMSSTLNVILNNPFLKWVGLLVVSINISKLSLLILRKSYFRVKRFCGYNPWKNIGKWAVVTGGSEGIGKAYAEELAARGFNICLISRNIDKLNSVAKEIAENYKVSTKTISVDFTDGPDIYKKIETELLELDGGIGVLVNNVGMSYKYAEYFHAIPDGFNVIWDLINSNITSCTMMMKIIMPMMNGKGIIINVSSLMAIYPMPLLAVYSASKSVLPSYVATKMSNRRPSLEIPSAKKYVSSAIKTVGIEDYTYGYFPHKIRGFIHQWLKANMPACFNLALSLHFMTKSRESYFRKMQKKEEMLKKESQASNVQEKEK
ncbi:very-long-chain 3-oxoacyl-CoA reductase [Trichonephila clavata]|uniref:Very-long-chain 3-oxoacyl-CoA reductase n=1 Tax=Trichonephila clavata TaxID=2740835 RepID=A0A8X6FZV3_TRICU|nr:very-long-chain 3-oxoacyl-CoA reductase [Trichonephila clavata]